MPKTLPTPAHGELLIKKSRFIACVQPVADRVSALRIVAALRARHPGAAHICWALLAGGHSAAADDGEPSGTAGRPMLEVLRHQDLEGVLATVVRYYGGVKLGAGGLVRAYTDAIAQTLLGAEKIAIVEFKTLACRAPYALEGTIRRELELHAAKLIRTEHGHRVNFEFSLSETAADTLIERLGESGRGQIEWLPPSALEP